MTKKQVTRLLPLHLQISFACSQKNKKKHYYRAWEIIVPISCCADVWIGGESLSSF